jgi:hypothetical protein
LFGARTAVETQRRNPVLTSVVHKSAQVYDRIPLRDFIDEARRTELARELYLVVNRICNSKKPVSTCREKYAAAMLGLAEFQVLMIRPPIKESPVGIWNQPGISGELNAHLVELFKKNDTLRAAKFGHSGIDSPSAHWTLVQRIYWERYWLLETLNTARIELGDCVADEDWHGSYLHAACVNAEHAYRSNLGLPPAFDESIARQAANAYSMFTDIVISGEGNPAAEWRSYYQDSGIPMPDFKTQ